MPKKAEAGFFVAGAGIMSSGDKGLAVTFIGIGMIILGAFAGNAALVVLDHEVAPNPLFPVVADKFPFLQDQPAVIQSIATTLETKVRALDVANLGTEVVELKFTEAEIESVLAEAIVTEAQAIELATQLK